MARLKTLQPRIQALGHRVGGLPPALRFGDARRGTRHERGYGSEWDRLRDQIMQHDCGLCRPCRKVGRVKQAHAVDHIVPKAEGGSDHPDNLQAICRECHTAKTAAESKRARGLG